MSRVLVYGAGPVGSPFAAQLQQGGNEASILARCHRLAELRERGIVLLHVLADPLMETALVNHAEAARSEVDHLIGEFMALARMTSVPTPTIDRLPRYYEPDAPPVPDGSAEIPLCRGRTALLVWPARRVGDGGRRIGQARLRHETVTNRRGGGPCSRQPLTCLGNRIGR